MVADEYAYRIYYYCTRLSPRMPHTAASRASLTASRVRCRIQTSFDPRSADSLLRMRGACRRRSVILGITLPIRKEVDVGVSSLSTFCRNPLMSVVFNIATRTPDATINISGVRCIQPTTRITHIVSASRRAARQIGARVFTRAIAAFDITPRFRQFPFGSRITLNTS